MVYLCGKHNHQEEPKQDHNHFEHHSSQYHKQEVHLPIMKIMIMQKVTKRVRIMRFILLHSLIVTQSSISFYFNRKFKEFFYGN